MKGSLCGFLYGYLCGTMVICLDHSFIVSFYVQILLWNHCYVPGPQSAKGFSILKFIFRYLCGTICCMSGPQFVKRFSFHLFMFRCIL
jgi:hypothetical protein